MSEPEQKCEICYSIVDGQHSPSCCYHADTCQESTLREELRRQSQELEAMRGKVHEAACLVLAAVTSEDGLDGSDVPKWIMDYGLSIAAALTQPAPEKP